MRTRISLLLIALILLGALSNPMVPVTQAVSSPSAGSWDLAGDFCANRNPCGAWSYGWVPSAESLEFSTLRRAGTSSWNRVPIWSNGGNTAPMIWKNTSSQTGFGVAPGQVALHPGPNGEYATVGWTTPTALVVQVDVRFAAGDTAPLDFYIYQSGRQLYHQRSAVDFDVSFMTHLGYAEHLEFRVGGGYDHGNTPLDVRITEIDSWDLATDFDPVHNPSVPDAVKDISDYATGWSYGSKASLDAPFQRFGWSGESSWNGVPMWSNGGPTETGPLIWKNTASETGFGVAPGQVALHPGPNGELAGIRWTAPDARKVQVSTSFGAGDSAELDYYVQHNGMTIYHERSAETKSTILTIDLDAEDTLDFLVGGGYTSGTTPLSIQIILAQWWNLESGGYDALHNPSRTWDYGWKASLDAPFQRFSWAGPSIWYNMPMWSNGGETGPLIWKNTKNIIKFGVDWGQVALHPGPNGELAGIRWTAPAARTVQVYTMFGAGDSAELDYYVQHNGTTIYHVRSTKTERYEITLQVNVGDTLEMLVGGGYDYGNTPVSMTVQEVGF